MIKKIINIVRFLWRLEITIECHISSKANIAGLHKLAYVSIDDYTYIAPNSNISYTKIGKYCSIGPNLLCGWGIHPTN